MACRLANGETDPHGILTIRTPGMVFTLGALGLIYPMPYYGGGVAVVGAGGIPFIVS